MFLVIILLLVGIFYFFIYVPSKKYAEEIKTLEIIVKPKAAKVKQALGTDWTVEMLNEKRRKGDPEADDLVKIVMAQGRNEMLNNFFQELKLNSDPLPDGMMDVTKAFFNETAVLPEWADKDMMRFGEEVYLRHGLFIGMLLFYKSLPQCYSGALGAEVMMKSARLTGKPSQNDDHFARRLAQTGLFLYDAALPNAMSPQGKGIRAAQKVRLIHATIRFFIKQHGNWDIEKFGEPINQEDMAGTLMSFSALVFEGLETLGVVFSEAETESYMHCWRVIGHIMGIDDDLIPVNAQDALNLGHAILDHQKAESGAGKALTSALVDFCDHKAPFFIKRDFHIKMMRFLINDDKLVDMLGQPMIPMEKLNAFKKTLKFYIGIRERLEQKYMFAYVLRGIDRTLLNWSVLYLSKTEVTNFNLPKSLQGDFEPKKTQNE